ncbi:MAG: hypothetical protein EAZ97_13530 [Bacteroidetes bacterium]|nr:MAG: hypothetical protein EAZ97_13530 [Bacteroidota bacterium]
MLSCLKTLHEPNKIYQTGEVPFLVTCEDLQTWVCKHGRLASSKLINEVLGAVFAKYWDLKTPEICLINVLEEHLPSKYTNILQPAFFKKPCFGSLYLENSKEIEASFIPSFEDKNFIKKIQNRDDFLKIALFDIWLSNEDRNHNNSNLLLEFSDNNQYYFYVFDHNAIFNSNALHRGLYQISEEESIINTDLAKILFKNRQNLRKNVDNLLKNFYVCVENCEVNLREILALIPNEWHSNIQQLELDLHKNIFEKKWLKECEINFITLFQKYIYKI